MTRSTGHRRRRSAAFAGPPAPLLVAAGAGSAAGPCARCCGTARRPRRQGGPAMLLLAAAACVLPHRAQAEATVVLGYRGHQYRTLDGTWPNSTTLGCQAFDWLPMPKGGSQAKARWDIADGDTSAALADALRVSKAYMWGCHCLVIQDADDTMQSIDTAWPLLEDEERETCASLSGGKVVTLSGNGVTVYQLPGNCRRSRQRLLIRRQCAPGCYHGPNMTTYPTPVEPYCARCANGTFSDWAASTCTLCLAGQFAARAASAYDAAGMCGATECQPCEAAPGFYCPPASTSISGEVCPAGYHCGGGDGDRVACMTGKFSDTVGASGISVCRDCTTSPGFYCPPASTSVAGTTCPPGYFCTGGVTDRQACAAGTYSPLTGASSSSACQNCLAGKYVQTTGNDAESDCEDCNAGTFSEAGASTCQDCSAPPGSYCPPGSGSPSGSRCPVAHYCSGGAQDKTPCPVNTYGPKTGARNVSSGCIRCATGFSEVGSSSCFICPVGTFSDPGKADPCPKCELGSYSPVPGAGACLTCAAGKYSESTGASVCTDCAGGMYSALAGTWGKGASTTGNAC